MRKVSVWALVMLVSLSLAVSGVAWAVEVPLRVDKDTVKSWVSDPQVVIIDVRVGRSWRASNAKIKGAIRQNPNEVKTWAASLPKDKKIVLYWSWPSEATSARVARQLRGMGFPQAMALKGGWKKWQKAGYPTSPK